MKKLSNIGNYLKDHPLFICLGVLLLAGAVVACIKLVHISQNRLSVDSLCDYGVEVFDVLLGGAAGDNTEAQDALRLCPYLVTTLRFGDEANWTEELYEPIDKLMEQFYQYGYLPREPYDTLENYVTSMDAPLLAVTAQLAYERSGNERFKKYVEDLIPYLVQDTSQMGYVLKLNDSEWWPLEYAWQDITEDDAWFVLNGSLYGMVCVEMLENLTGDVRLTELSEKALNAYRTRADSFLYPDGSWCWYDLNSKNGQKNINSIEKMLIELRAYKSLYVLTNESFYLEQYNVRRDLLEAALPMYVCRTEQGNTAMLLRACLPHPYMVDTYQSTIEFLDEKGNVVATTEATSREVENSYIKVSVPDSVKSYRLWGQINTVDKTLLVEAPVIDITPEALELSPVSGKWSATEDGQINDKKLTVTADATESLNARIYFDMETALTLQQNTYIIVELNNHSDQTVPMRGYFYDENGNAADRTLLPCKPGKSIQILNHIGFRNLSFPIAKLQKMSFAFATNNMTEPVAEIEIGNIYVCQNTAQVISYLDQYEWKDYWSVIE